MIQAIAPAVAAGPDAPQAAVKFYKWIDPTEHAFSVDVPQGWQASGGVNWTGPIDAQAFVRVQSPDAKVQIFVGDPEILPRTVPNAAYARMGAVEGRAIPSPSGGSTLIQRFLTGSQYSRHHAAWRLCRNPRWVSEANLPELSRSITASIEQQARQWRATARASAGEASFLCDSAQGYVFATTVLTSSPGGAIQTWAVYKLSGFVSSDPMRSMQARYIMERMVATATVDPRWEQAYEKRIKDVTGAVISMQNAAAQVQRSAAQSASSTLARLNHPNTGVSGPRSRTRSSVNTTLGTKDVCDAIGRCKSVSTDADNYFMDHSGNVRPGRAGGAPPDNSGVWSPTYTR